MSDTGVTLKKNEDFSEWYTEVVLKSEMAEYAPIKGCMILREQSYAIWEKIQEVFNRKIKETGHKNVYFPIFIPESFLKKEAEHFEGFVPEVAWVTEGGNTKLEEKLAIRPTSETIIYATFAKWIRSWRDLPIKINQWCNIIRWETKATKPFLRTREFLWQEGHTAHVTSEEAEKEVMDILGEYKDVMENYLAIPVLVGVKTDKEKFAGALYTTTLEAMMPDGKALQMGTSHNLGQNFARVFDINFIGEDEKEHKVWQTSWGISTRLIGALVMVHGDDRGLVMPPRVAPVQVVIVPITYKVADSAAILAKAKEILDKLKVKHITTVLDNRTEYTPGWKFNEWELKGVPVRIEIGPRDLKQDQVTLARRDTYQKTTAKMDEAVQATEKLLEEIQKNLYAKAKTALDEKTTTVQNYDDFQKTLKNKGGFIKAAWCGNSKCEEKIKEETGASIRLKPFEKEKNTANCVCCGKKDGEIVYFAKSY
ncbi:proline--tRNA ligase [miscellaneous Crenarchaeota group-1 archaeon SG8-32-3]|uniref:Proline--tRNA ligase n=1 Tax=miscellaneous Crenarchaeota group-1 archaeon SG8-32-3 TaxID=1685125 RepID=A0A0M0BSQ1_9ARCH|nr:MAG: proline--tRNA ligase [miscellaneous Crenarchaeota group-1 archaeon SG8-32-3]